MITRELIDRINELARKQRQAGLTPAEKEEQAILRRQYIENIKAQVKQTLESIEFVEELPEMEFSCSCGCQGKHHHHH
ncbi:MAG: DUF896 domain-containing protein [Bacillota bacterium]|uniref:UPF0291 protein SAMN02745885_01759 n=2 Tax=Carboxydocella TaxID=178898 RepID=A0A1T4QPV7_9FIRM|nr:MULTISPECIES: DUF896 domain-containing protein [Carboxydocella]AVX21532.1 Uncharacterized protein YnzC, UPF0291/DUF896 family [Carboxydocella thermautotrophica]AVX32012.1 Uncharacterized protein YnzC, UPF0291/DUF896 family [Carboxydocella thermautotrophica]SKA05789.1 Uncharacterized protein YnzC, UPF0291/DUF896 family [Carboxydocella sporoproducens DSM 16521]GAW27755.1 DUF896 family protein [Carboxydocella sp. ULO1]GAW31947.1 DUF896 family protein [Carboxydocella sp. JDF658]